MIQDAYYSDARGRVVQVVKNLLKYLGSEKKSLEKNQLAEAEASLQRMISEFGYNEESAKDTIFYVAHNFYLDSQE